MSTDGNLTVINPLAVTVSEPAGEVEVQKGPKPMADKDIQAYAEMTGQTVLKIREISQSSILGELMQRIGTEKIGNAMLIKNQEMILDGLRECTSMIGDYAHEPNVVAMLAKVKLGLIGEWNKAAHTFIRSKRDSTSEEPNNIPQNIPPPPLVPVQINIHGNQVSGEKTIN